MPRVSSETDETVRSIVPWPAMRLPTAAIAARSRAPHGHFTASSGAATARFSGSRRSRR